MNNYYSSRKIESACRRDVNFMYFLEGALTFHYSTIARFRSLHFAPVAEKIMTEMANFLAKNEEISLENLFIYGTKIEVLAQCHQINIQ